MSAVPTLLVPAGAEERAVRRSAPGARIVVIRAGAAAVRSLPPELDGELVVLGLCGALAPLPVGATVVCTSVTDEIGELTLEDVTLPGAAHVRAYTSPHVISRANAKHGLAERTGAAVVEMEGTHLARALAARGLRCAMVRVVSDGNNVDLPRLDDAFDADGNLKPAVVAVALARNPRLAARFVADVRRALRVLGETARLLTSVRA